MGKQVVPFGYRFTKKHGLVKIPTEQPTFEHTFPEGFCVVRDTREQTGLFLPPPKGLTIVIDTLQYGDYSVRGFESSIAVERKNIDDLWSSVTVHAERFKRELDALVEFERKWLLIEGLESDYLCHRPDRKIHPNSIRQALASIEGRLGIPVHQCESRAAAERWILDVFIKYYKMKRGD